MVNDEDMSELVQSVCAAGSPLVVECPSTGNAVRIIPVPKPVRYDSKGEPVYRAEDLQYLVYDYPWLLEWFFAG